MPALRFRLLTPLYDHVGRLTTRERYFKSLLVLRSYCAKQCSWCMKMEQDMDRILRRSLLPSMHRDLRGGPNHEPTSKSSNPAGAAVSDAERSRLLRRGLRLEAFSISWDVIEGVVAVWAGIVSGSTTLMGFGFESIIEVTAAGTLYWRLRKELRGEAPRGEVEQRALWIVGIAFFVLASYVAYESISKLVQQQGPEMSVIGMAMAAAALIVMPFLAYAKNRTGRQLQSEALIADSRETIASTYLSLTVLLGLGLNGLFSWWWSDSVAALAMLPYLAWAGIDALKEARESDRSS